MTARRLSKVAHSESAVATATGKGNKIGAGINCGPASGESCVAWTGASSTLSNRVAAIPSELVAISQAIQLKAFARITGRAKATGVLTLFGQ